MKTKTVKNEQSKPMVFKSKLLNSLIEEDNISTTFNGAKTYKSSLNHLVDFFAMGAALRKRSEDEIISLFTKAFAEDKLLALKLLFYIRDCRGGQGERNTFKILLNYIGNLYPNLVKKNIENIVSFGRFDDIYSLFDTKSENIALEFVKNQLNKDLAAFKKKKNISLLAKWLPSENASSKDTKKKSYKIINFLGWEPRKYRKTLSLLRSYLNIVEKKMCSNDWQKINFAQVPSKASLNYRGAFLKHENFRYLKYLEEVKSGKEKINASVLYPYEIVEKALASKGDDTLDLLWQNLPNYLEGNDRNILVVADVSLSMAGRPLHTSIGLALYTAERNRGFFHNYFITFSTKPSLQKIIGSNIVEKIKNLRNANWCMSTNLQAVFDLVLSKAIKENLKNEDLPSQILIISDTEFDSACEDETNLENIRKKYKASGYEAPQLVFWNVNSLQNNVAAKSDDRGVILVSGSSPSVFKTLLMGKEYSPTDQMLEVLNQERYDTVVI